MHACWFDGQTSPPCVMLYRLYINTDPYHFGGDEWPRRDMHKNRGKIKFKKCICFYKNKTSGREKFQKTKKAKLHVTIYHVVYGWWHRFVHGQHSDFSLNKIKLLCQVKSSIEELGCWCWCRLNKSVYLLLYGLCRQSLHPMNRIKVFGKKGMMMKRTVCLGRKLCRICISKAVLRNIGQPI